MTMNKNILSALIGLVGAINNNGKTPSSDTTIRKALLSDDSSIEDIHHEKYEISPNCASCKSPCGNTSDYPIASFDEWSDEQKELKEQIMEEIMRIAGNGNTDSELPDIVLKGIAYIGYDLEEEHYRKLLDEMKRQ